MTAEVSFTGSLARAPWYGRALTAALSFVGSHSVLRGKVFGATMSFRPYRAEVLADSPQHYWRLGEGSAATTFTDVGSSPHTLEKRGTASRVVPASSGALTDDTDTAVFFDNSGAAAGAGGLLSSQNPTSSTGINFYGSSGQLLTVEGWAKGTALSSIMRQQDPGVFVFLHNGNTHYVETDGGTDSLSPVGLLNDDQWHHYAMVWDYPANSMRAYRDGELFNSKTGLAGSEITSPAAPFTVGGFLHGNDIDHSEYMTGSVDELAIYTTVLSDERIRAHYRTGRSTHPKFAARGQKNLTGALSFVGNLPKLSQRALVGVVSFAGAFVKETRRGASAALNFAGSLFITIPRELSGAVSFAGAFGRLTAKSFTASLGFVGGWLARANKAFGAGLSFTTSLTRGVARPLAATVSFAGAVAARVARELSGSISFATSTTKSFLRSLTASTGFVGSLTRTGQKVFGASLGFLGGLSMTKFVSMVMSGALNFAVNFGASLAKNFAAGISPLGAFNHRANKAFSGAIDLTGTFLRLPNKAFNGAVTFSSTFRIPMQYANLFANLSFGTGLFKVSRKSLVASLSFTTFFQEKYLWLQVQLAALPTRIDMAFRKYVESGINIIHQTGIAIRDRLFTVQHEENYSVTIRVVGPDER